MSVQIDVLIPTCNRLPALNMTILGLYFQENAPTFRILISDQSETFGVASTGELRFLELLLSRRGVELVIRRHLPRRGMAEQRDFLLSLATAPYVLYLDDDLVLEKDVIRRLYKAILQEGCGFVGAAPIGLSFAEDVRPEEQKIEFWTGPVRPEKVQPGDQEWQRHKLHNAANLLHIQGQQKLEGGADYLAYKVAWVGGCVLFNADKLREVGGYGFWRDIPESHCGEDVAAQLKVMERFGGCGILPSGVYHQELVTTLPDRRWNVPENLQSRH